MVFSDIIPIAVVQNRAHKLSRCFIRITSVPFYHQFSYDTKIRDIGAIFISCWPCLDTFKDDFVCLKLVWALKFRGQNFEKCQKIRKKLLTVILNRLLDINRFRDFFFWWFSGKLKIDKAELWLLSASHSLWNDLF